MMATASWREATGLPIRRMKSVPPTRINPARNRRRTSYHDFIQSILIASSEASLFRQRDRVPAGEDGHRAAFLPYMLCAIEPLDGAARFILKNDVETLVPGLQVVERTGDDRPPAIDNRYVIRNLLDLGQLVRGKENRDAFRGRKRHDFAKHILNGDRIEAIGRLVQNQ